MKSYLIQNFIWQLLLVASNETGVSHPSPVAAGTVLVCAEVAACLEKRTMCYTIVFEVLSAFPSRSDKHSSSFGKHMLRQDVVKGIKYIIKAWIALSDGTRWKKISGRNLLARLSMEAPSMNISLFPIYNQNKNHDTCVTQQWLPHLLAQFSAKHSFVK